MAFADKSYSALALARNALRSKPDWRPAWRSPAPQPRYDVVIVGGGGHGLATAYHLAKTHRAGRIAVLERGWIGGGNTGRNTTIVRSNYYYPQSAAFYELALKGYEGLSRELNFNIMLSQRGNLDLAHSRADLDFLRRTANATRLNGVDVEVMDARQVRDFCPILNFSPKARFPIWGGALQRRAGTVRHDAVAWGYARAADAHGVDIIQNCEVTGMRRDPVSGAVQGLDTTLGYIAAPKVGMAAAGHSGPLAEMAGFRLPVVSYGLQAYVSEPIKPLLHTVVFSPLTGSYASQSDKGGLVIGGALDRFASFAQRGSAGVAEVALAGILEIIPAVSRVRLLRQWAGVVDYTYDSSPILGLSPVPGLYLNCGWGGGGFKAIPAGGITFAHTIATGAPHPLVEGFSLERFREGRLIDEAAAAGIEH